MSEAVALVAQLSAPIKVAWLLWMIWVVVQVVSYRRMRQPVPVSEPELSQAAQPHQVTTASRSRRRRRRGPAQLEVSHTESDPDVPVEALTS